MNSTRDRRTIHSSIATIKSYRGVGGAPLSIVSSILASALNFSGKITVYNPYLEFSFRSSQQSIFCFGDVYGHMQFSGCV